MADELINKDSSTPETISWKVRWKNRRRMAWISLIAMITVTCLILFTNLVSESRLQILSDVITWFYFSMSSVIGMYMGATTWASIKK